MGAVWTKCESNVGGSKSLDIHSKDKGSSYEEEETL